MAYPWAPPWTRKNSAFTILDCFPFFSATPNSQLYKRPRLITFCVDPSSSPSSCSSNSHSTRVRYLKSENAASENAKFCDGSFSIVASEESMLTLEKEEEEEAKHETAPSKIVHLGSSLKVKKRPFWRKILFASKKMKSVLLLNVAVVVYASNIPVVKAVETAMDPAAFSAVRFVVSAIPFLPFVFQARDDLKTRNAGIELGMWVSLGYLIEALGLLTSEAGRASFISLFTVIVVPLLGGMLGAIIPARTWFGVLMSALGLAMLECSGSPPNIGDLLNFLSAIFFGIHILRTEHISRTTKKENFLPLLGYEVCVVAVLSTIWVVIGGWFDGVEALDQSLWTLAVLWDWLIAFPWIPALYTGIFSTGLCLWIEIAAMRDVSATETAIIYSLEPVWGAGFAWFLLGERWGTFGWIGSALVLGGSLMVQIFGTTDSIKSFKFEDKKLKDDHLRVSNEQKLNHSLSTSPLVVRPQKDATDMLK
uniref:Uncharacterized protein LOC103338699 n=1 Tax=Rhizophora mucronata TaxID=61149 RepID=A0A2P2QNT5_RHIMU